MFRVSVAVVILVAMAAVAFGQQDEAPTADEAARELSNPNTALASITFKNQFRSFAGELPHAGDQSSYMLLFQPVLPFPRQNGSKIIFRPAVPLLVGQPIYRPALNDFEAKTGLGDIAFDLVYAFPPKGNQLMALGLISSLPTASGDLGTDRFTLGPEFLLGMISPQHVAAIFPSHQWDLAGSGEADISLTTLQVIYVHLPGGGWNVGTAPIMTYDWNASQWNIPLQVNLGKTVTLGGTPWKFSLEVNYYVERRDDLAAEWMIGLNVTPVVKNYAASMLNDLLK